MDSLAHVSEGGWLVHRTTRLILTALLVCACSQALKEDPLLPKYKAAAVQESTSPAALPAPRTVRVEFANIRSWAIQLTGYDRPEAMDALCRADVDLLVIDPILNVIGQEDYPIPEFLAEFRASRGPSNRGRLCLAYVNVAEAESYRTYWESHWCPPGDGRPGSPRFLIGEDQEGWAENFTVRYWDPQWQEVLFGRACSVVDQIIDCGFDGVFLDWVAAWSDEVVAREALNSGVDPAKAMAKLILKLAKHARQRSPGFLLLANNGAQLLVSQPRVAEALNGVAQESLCFEGTASSDWDDPENADREQSADAVEWAMTGLAQACLKSLMVFTIDYATWPENVDAAEQFARSHGFVPFVSRTPLDRLPRNVPAR